MHCNHKDTNFILSPTADSIFILNFEFIYWIVRFMDT